MLVFHSSLGSQTIHLVNPHDRSLQSQPTQITLHQPPSLTLCLPHIQISYDKHNNNKYKYLVILDLSSPTIPLTLPPMKPMLHATPCQPCFHLSSPSPLSSIPGPCFPCSLTLYHHYPSPSPFTDYILYKPYKYVLHVPVFLNANDNP